MMPRWFTQLRLRVRSLFQRRRADEELDEELQYHLEREIELGVSRGLSREEARYAALRAMGAVTQNKEACRDSRGVNWMEDLLQDIRYGARTLRKNPTFTVVAAVALATGIGANTAMFSLVYGILLRPLPYREADRVAGVHLTYAARDFPYGTLCVRDYLIWKEHNRVFEEPVLFRAQRVDIARQGSVPEQVQGAFVSAGFFSTLGMRPLIGRALIAGEDQPNAASVSLISEGMWRSRFGSDPNVLGRTIVVNGAASTIIGVMPGEFQLPRIGTDVWTNVIIHPPTRYGPWFYRGLARLKPGVTWEQAQAEMNSIARVMEQRNPDYKRVSLPILSVRDAIVGPALRPAMLALGGAVGLVLLIAVVNVANLMLARGTVRQREMALRLSLGAGRGRLMRQLLTESVLLSLMGGIAGLAVAWGSIQLIRVWNPGSLPLIESVRLDWAALTFTALVSTVTGVLFGLAPALGSARADLNHAMKEGSRSSAGGGRASGRARAALVMSEIALSLVLLVGAGLLLRSFVNLQRVTGGFFAPPDRVLTMLISPSDRKYNEAPARNAFYEEVLRRTRNLPGAEEAAISDSLPPDRQGDADSFRIEGQTLAPGEMNPVVSAITASSGMFEALGIPLVKGRYFTEHDRENSTPVAIVSEGFARRFFPNQAAIGKRIKQGGDWMEIVGVVGNVKYLGLTVDTDPAYYMPYRQQFARRMFLVVRASGSAVSNLAEMLRREVHAVDSGVTLTQVSTMEQALDSSVSRPRFNTMLLALFAGIALILAAVGIYGLIAYSVAQRTREIGVRMALGAVPGDVVALVVRQALSLAVAGIGMGVAGAIVLTRFLRTMLFGVEVTDALTFAAAGLGILFVVVLATFVPAVRATRVSPVVALRYE